MCINLIVVCCCCCCCWEGFVLCWLLLPPLFIFILLLCCSSISDSSLFSSRLTQARKKCLKKLNLLIFLGGPIFGLAFILGTLRNSVVGRWNPARVCDWQVSFFFSFFLGRGVLAWTLMRTPGRNSVCLISIGCNLTLSSIAKTNQ